MNPNLIKELRRASNLSQIQLSQGSGVSRFRIQLAEAGTLQLRQDELRAIEATVRPLLIRTAELLTTELGFVSDSAPKSPPSEGHCAQGIGDKESKP